MKTFRLTSMFFIFILAMGVSVSSFAAPPMQISTEYDHFTNFGTLKTYAWNPSFQPDTSNFKPDGLEALKNIIDSGIEKKGYSKNSAGAPDFYVYYWLTKKDEMEQVKMFSGRGEWNTVETRYTAGTFVLDFSDPKTGRTLWRGWLQAEVKPELPMAKRQERATSAVSKLLAKFPPK